MQRHPDVEEVMRMFREKELRGRLADEDLQLNASILVRACELASPGTYLEIGTLHGGSLIAVTRARMRKYGKAPAVVIDPLNGYYYGQRRGASTDPITLVPITLEVLNDNLRTAFPDGCEVRVSAEKSWPWPLPEEQYSCAFIDGDHWGDSPTKDWHNVHPRTTDVVVFDNVDELHPAVVEAVEIASVTPDWMLLYHYGIVAVLVRRSRWTAWEAFRDHVE